MLFCFFYIICLALPALSSFITSSLDTGRATVKWPCEFLPIEPYPIEYQQRIKANLCINPHHYQNDLTHSFMRIFTAQLFQYDSKELLKKQLHRTLSLGFFKCKKLARVKKWNNLGGKDKLRGLTLHTAQGELVFERGKLFSFLNHQNQIQNSAVPDQCVFYVHRLQVKRQKDAHHHHRMKYFEITEYDVLSIDYCHCNDEIDESFPHNRSWFNYASYELLPLFKEVSFVNPMHFYGNIHRVLQHFKKLTLKYGRDCLKDFAPHSSLIPIKFPFMTQVVEWQYPQEEMNHHAILRIPPQATNFIVRRIFSVDDDDDALDFEDDNNQLYGTSIQLSCVWSYPEGQPFPTPGTIYMPNQEIAKIWSFDENYPVPLHWSVETEPWLRIYQSDLVFHLFYLAIRWKMKKTTSNASTNIHDYLTRRLLDSNLMLVPEGTKIEQLMVYGLDGNQKPLVADSSKKGLLIYDSSSNNGNAHVPCLFSIKHYYECYSLCHD